MNLPQVSKQQDHATASSDHMMAAILTAPGKFEMRELPLAEPGPGELRIRLEGTGVCASNIPLWEGRDWFTYPVAAGEPGHEGWGVVEALGPQVQDLQPGQRVCFLSGKAYATHDLTRADQVVILPASLGNMPFPGEPLGCAMNIFERSDIRPGQTVAIMGLGFLGLLLTQLCKHAGAHVIAISRREFSLKAAEKCGADHLIPLDDHGKIIDQVRQISGGKWCDRVIEATGKEWPLNLSIEITGVKGKLIVAGFHQDGMRQLNVQMLNWRGIDMISAHERDAAEYVRGMENAIVAIQQDRMDPVPLFSHEFQLDEINQAFQHLTHRLGGFIKALIIF